MKQFLQPVFTCPKCTEESLSCSSYSSISWTNGCNSKHLPRLIHDVNSNALLISRVYQCNNGHEVYAHHPTLISNFELNNHVPFYLWHSTGFTKTFMDYVDQLISCGVSLQQCERNLLDNRVRLFYRVREAYKAAHPSIEILLNLQDMTLLPFKDIPTRHAITGCFLYIFWQNHQTYIAQMIAGSVTSPGLWLSCDHTFHAAANIGLFREVDGKWIEQYNGLFCVLNSVGEILTWKLTKGLSFLSIEDQLIGLQHRLQRYCKKVDEFYIDNCCSWRKKLQSIFGPDLKVKLDIFHAVQRITKKIPKRHLFHSECVCDLKLAFRHPSDKGKKRTMPTPDGIILHANLLAFQHKWESVTHGGVHVLPAAAIIEINCLLKHVKRGCLSGIMPGRGTSRNERLHKELNKVISSSRYGIELAYALITHIFYIHNENLRSPKGRLSRPISAYASTCTNDLGLQSNPLIEIFGLATPRSDETCMELVEPIPGQARALLCELDYHKVISVHQSTSNEDDISESLLSKEHAMNILEKAITHYYITQDLMKLSKTATFNERNLLFVSFLALIKQSCDKHHTESADISSVLSPWNFMQVPVPGDGNCLFTSVALSIIERIQNHDQTVIDFITTLGLSEGDCDVTRISKHLRELVVAEWIGDNSDYYQSFVTSDIQSEAEQYLNSGEFAGNLGDLMVVTLSNVLHLPIMIFTTITNLPVICITPVTNIESTIPLYLTYNHVGPGHYDYAIPIPSPPGNEKVKTFKGCYCGRKKEFKGVPCSLDVLGHCKCPCAKKGNPCQSACKCKGCCNQHGTRPPPLTTRRRQLYQTQKQSLSGIRGTNFLKSINEKETIGHTSVLEGLLIMGTVVYFMMSGIELNIEKFYQAYNEVIDVSSLCPFVTLPIFRRSKQYIARYLNNITKVITLFQTLMDTFTEKNN